MKLLQLTLKGSYKGLANQTFDFRKTNGNVIALIGLNGCGKSQLMELIAETFSFLERWQRNDFTVRTELPFSVTVEYETATTPYSKEMAQYQVTIEQKNVRVKPLNVAQECEGFYEDPIPLPDFIVGYSSGLNENLQRPFLKNSVQFFDVFRIRYNRTKEISKKDLPLEEKISINERYYKKNSHLFELFEEGDYSHLSEKDVTLPKMIYLDYDSNALLLVALSFLGRDELTEVFGPIEYVIPQRVVLSYNLRGLVIEKDTIEDIKLLIDVGGSDSQEGIGKKSTDEEFELYDLDYLTGKIHLDLSVLDVRLELMERNYNDPLALFKRLYKIQALGVKNWDAKIKQSLRKDDFLGTIKKPLKSKLPLAVDFLELANSEGQTIVYDDLSDGEAQLMHVTSAAKIFGQSHTLFLFDEPETHLNPSWRTHFHQYLQGALNPVKEEEHKSHVLMSTHSPFTISSLRKENVFSFERSGNNLITTNFVSEQTYGASFDVLIKRHFGLRSLVSQTVVADIKRHLPQHDNPDARFAAREWIEENIGSSAEKAYLLKKLRD